jgi:uncharacterized protein
MKQALLILLACAAFGGVPPCHAETGIIDNGHPSSAAGISWQGWSDDLFERAKKENRFVILDLEAIWCHWCHVMDAKTYSNPDVIKVLKSKFITVKVDQDSRPDLSNRYEDYGWPATIVFSPGGVELVKKAGFIPPEEMVAMLSDVIKNPTPKQAAKKTVVQYAQKGALPAALRNALTARHVEYYDTKLGSWGVGGQKYLDWDSVEYALERAKAGDATESNMARQTLTAQLNLLDPVWGGVYQYSTNGDWKHPHFEKIMQMQGENLKVYSQGYALLKDPKHLQAAKSIYGYLKTFLTSPDGAFYTSQDADVERGKHSDWYYKLNDADRRKNGLPRIDKHIYARENGWAINGITHLYMVTGDRQYLDAAVKAADWIVANRSLDGGGFSHDEKDASGPFLGDTLYMGRAFLTLYQATGDRAWLKKAEAAANFINQQFKPDVATQPGFITAKSKANMVHKPEALLDENVVLARFANLLYRYSGNGEYKKMADSSMRYLATPEIANKRRYLVAGILLADKELAAEPIHITVIGGKADLQAQLLFAEALKYPVTYKRVEWWDPAEGPMPNAEVEYPKLPKAAAFGCAGGRCSLPIYRPENITKTIDAFSKG